MEYTFKKHKISPDDKVWLRVVYDTIFVKRDKFDPKVAKILLKDKISKGYNPSDIDSRLIMDGKNLTVIGIWFIDPDSIILKNIDTTIRTIKNMIYSNPGLDVIMAKDIAKNSDIDEAHISKVLHNLAGLGRFYSSATDMENEQATTVIRLMGDNAYDEYIEYESLEGLMEKIYRQSEPVSKRPFGLTTDLWDANVLNTPITNFTLPYYPYGDTNTPSLSTPTIKKNTAFILMAMDKNKPELQDIHMAIKEVCAKFGINAYRADELEHSDRITDLILREIELCEFIIADLSYERPNVYYEVGYAHSKEKRPILYRKQDTRLHFDLAVHNVPEYKNTTELRSLLSKRLEAITGKTLSDEKSK